MENYINRAKVEGHEKWKDLTKDIPIINFKSEWDVKIIPPFAGAVARFLIIKDNKRICSVYLDWYDRLGYVGEPYYELYPFEDDVKRYLLSETKELIEDIDSIWKNS